MVHQKLKLSQIKKRFKRMQNRKRNWLNLRAKPSLNLKSNPL